jgi:hypothetical protein
MGIGATSAMARTVVPRRVMDRLEAEVGRQDSVHPGGYPTTRDGVRLGLASLEDELREAMDAWDGENRGNQTWPRTYDEVEQVAAVALRILRGMDGTR